MPLPLPLPYVLPWLAVTGDRTLLSDFNAGLNLPIARYEILGRARATCLSVSVLVAVLK